jgi:hypothetical protein
MNEYKEQRAKDFIITTGNNAPSNMKHIHTIHTYIYIANGKKRKA